MVRVLVTGGRNYAERKRKLGPCDTWKTELQRCARQAIPFYAALDQLAREHEFVQIIVGDCPTGTDRLARHWARKYGMPAEVHGARWDTEGRLAAGPKRNTRMVKEGRASVCVFTLGGRGTADCVKKARAAGLRMIDVQPLGSGEKK